MANLSPGSALPDTSFESRVAEIESRLRRVYGAPRHHNPAAPLDDLMFLVLSRMTQEVKYRRTYEALRRRFPKWSDVLDSTHEELVRLLQDAGLAETKAAHIRRILETILEREGRLDLSRLALLPDDEVESYLTSLPGVAAKTARCVMLYALGRDTLPVDAHVWRIACRLGLAPQQPWSDRGGRDLQERVPRGIRGSLHVILIAHGRAVCKARRPICSICSLYDCCPTAASCRCDGEQPSACTLS